MDNNLQTPLPTQPVLPVQPQAPQQSASFITESPKEENSSKLVLFLFLGLIIIALAVGGGYWYLSKGGGIPFLSNQTNNKVEVNKSPLPVIQQVKEESVDEQFNSINIATDDADFAPIDQDIQGL